MQHKAVSADQFGSFSLCKPAVMFLSLRTLVATLFQTYSDNVLHATVYSALQEKSKSERMERKPQSVPSFLTILSTCLEKIFFRRIRK